MLKREHNNIPIFILIIIITFAVTYLILSPSGRNLSSFLWGLVFKKTIQLKKTDSSINILALGVGGGEHQGPNLSDTIIFAHIDPTKNKVDVISIPRDLWIPDISAKVNTAYAYGEEKEGRGIELTRAVIEKVIGQEINYTIVINFKAFTQLVDLLGGLDVNVKRTFDDYEYPIEGKETDPCDHAEEELITLATFSSQLEVFPCRYTHVHFDKGVAHMNGEKALQYVRSRHAEGFEGTDFARSDRQHQVILATKDKLLSLGTLFNPVKLIGIYNVLRNNINTNINPSEMDDFIRLAQKMKESKINNAVIDAGDNKEKRLGLLQNPPSFEQYMGQWVLIPRKGNGDFSEIHEYIKCNIDGKLCKISEDGILIIDGQTN